MTPYYSDQGVTLLQGDSRDRLRDVADGTVNACITSPPYFGLRDYGVDGQIGLETEPDQYIEKLVAVFREVRRRLRDDGTLWLNIGDSYANDGKWGGRTGGKHAAALHCSPIGRNKKYTGLKPKDLIGIPWMLAFALRADGWYLRSDIIWHKPNVMPESVTDRPTKAHEYLFLLSKSERYYFDAESVKEPIRPESIARSQRNSFSNVQRAAAMPGTPPSARDRGEGTIQTDAEGRNVRTVWNVAVSTYAGAHFATFPEELVKPCVLAGCPEGGLVLDPFAGAGTTLKVARDLGRRATGIELKPEYCGLIVKRLAQGVLFGAAEVPA